MQRDYINMHEPSFIPLSLDSIRVPLPTSNNILSLRIKTTYREVFLHSLDYYLNHFNLPLFNYN